MDKINSDLRGASFYDKLVWKTGEGFDVMPFYRQEDLEHLWSVDSVLPLVLSGDYGQPADRGVSSSWLVRQDIPVTDYAAANGKALSILMNGVDSIGFIITDPGTVNDENFSLLLQGINPECVEINFIPEGKAREMISLISSIWTKNGSDLSKIKGAVEADPLGRLMLNGQLCIQVDAGIDYLASLVSDTLVLPAFRSIRVNGLNFRNAGSGPVRELALAISMAVEYLNLLTGRGISPEVAARAMKFRFGTGTSFFMEIAKLRAARLLWSVVCEKYGITGKDASRMEIHCETSVNSSVVDDPYKNLLRTQTEAMSAITGGADSLTVVPFDTPLNQAGEFSERIARNQQLILREEAYFNRVSDPSAGSYYIEKLTALVAEKAWDLFLETEKNGGFLTALDSGLINTGLNDQISEEEKSMTT
jgi:methylmalonyl-CoA mutase